jgi:ATP-dependent helicase HrpA
MKALQQRLERVAGQYPKDQKYTASLQALTQPLLLALQERPALLLRSVEARTYRWMLEEFRVSLFAQNLGTRQAVSEKRLREQWCSVSQWLDQNPH